MGPGLVRKCWYQGGRLPETDVCHEVALGASIKDKWYPLPDPRGQLETVGVKEGGNRGLRLRASL